MEKSNDLSSRVKRGDMGIAGAIIVLCQLISTIQTNFQSKRNISSEMDDLKSEFHKVLLVQKKYFVRKEELLKVDRKIDVMNAQLIKIRNKISIAGNDYLCQYRDKNGH